MLRQDTNWVNRVIKKCVIHCADTPDDNTAFTEKDIDDWHVARGFKRMPEYQQKWKPSLSAIGYHYVILRNGDVKYGRSESEIGAHAKGANASSIGVCLMGRKKYTQPQWDSLKELCKELSDKYARISFIGHYEVDPVNKANCPGFDVKSYVVDFVPDQRNVYEH